LFISNSVNEPLQTTAAIASNNSASHKYQKFISMNEQNRMNAPKQMNLLMDLMFISTDKFALNFIDVGRLKANNGNQNYNIPYGNDLSKYTMVLIWCKISVLFGSGVTEVTHEDTIP
jgi:electron transfer DM13